jgi:hypothetical protein
MQKKKKKHIQAYEIYDPELEKMIPQMLMLY